jgi:hypothetical protein
MPNITIPVPVCNNSWARAHYFLNKDTGETFPARCGTWRCLPCARHNTRRVYGLIHAGRPERFITLSFAGKSKESLYRHYRILLQRIRQKGWKFEAVAVNEIHLTGDLHLHIAQRGDDIPQNPWLWDNWLDIIKDDYPHFKTVNARIDRVEHFEDPKKALYAYMTKYMVKTWETDTQKAWSRVQALHPGLRHYRYTRGWRLVPALGTGGPSPWELHLEPVPRAIEGEYEALSRADRERDLIRVLRREVDVKGFSTGTPVSGPQTGPLTGTAPKDWL